MGRVWCLYVQFHFAAVSLEDCLFARVFSMLVDEH